MTRRTKGGLLRWLGTALATGAFGMLAFAGGVGAGAAVTSYLERTGTLAPPASVLAQRPIVSRAVPEFRRPYEEPVEQAVAVPPQVVADPPASPDAATAPASGTPPETSTADAPVPPAWMLAAVPVSVPPDRPMVAIIFDDLAVDQARSRRVIELPGPLTMSFLPYGRNLDDLAAAARARARDHDPPADGAEGSRYGSGAARPAQRAG